MSQNLEQYAEVGACSNMHVPHTHTYMTKWCLINAPSQGYIDLLYVPHCRKA